MTVLDGAVVALYLAAMLGLSLYLGRRQRDLQDYYLGGNRLAWWAVGVSVLATQSSAISFVSVPAFVATAPGGGARWLHYELAVPLAMLALGVSLVPALRRQGCTTIYEFLEQRFDQRVRGTVAVMFLLARGLSTGVAVYATAIVLEVALGLPLAYTILLIGGITALYDLFGGMAAVIVSDVIQAVVLILGLGLVIWCIGEAGEFGIASAWQGLAEARRATLVDAGGAGELAAFVLGGLFLYASYYGCDQSQAQRLLATRGVAGSRAALALNGVVRFPLTLAYLAVGVMAAGLMAAQPQFAQAVAGERADYLLPLLVVEVVPPGLRGLIYAALLAAAMSSLDSAINALSATTVQDFWLRRRRGADISPRRLLTLGRLTTLFWGALVTVFAFFVDDIAATVIESINRIGSAFFGPVLAVFVLALAARRAPPRWVQVALLTGVLGNLGLWLFVPAIHWMWWNLIGFVVTATLGQVRAAPAAIGVPAPSQVATHEDGEPAGDQRAPWWFWGVLLGWFAVIVAVTGLLGA